MVVLLYKQVALFFKPVKRKAFLTQRLEEDRVAALIKREKILADSRQAVQHLQDLCSLYYLQRNIYNTFNSS